MKQEAGELTVIGKNSFEIALKQRPRSIKVEFADDCIVIPCDPKDFDSLEFYTFQRKDGINYLFIGWKVSGTRDIEWKVQY